MRKKKIKIGVMGSASGPLIRDQTVRHLAFSLGSAIASKGCILVTGACPGLPDEAARGAREQGGLVLGISPAFSEREHLEIYGSPIEHYDIILYTGMGLMERDIINIRSSDAVALVGGGMGTLNEFTVAFEERKPIGVLKGSGGISENLPQILEFTRRRAGPERVIYDSDPLNLVERLIEVVLRLPPPFRESDIGGEKEAGAYDSAEAVRREQRRAHDFGQQQGAEKESK